jgi:hypothetical protein
MEYRRCIKAVFTCQLINQFTNFTDLNWNISIAYPWWFVLLCLLVGLAYAAILYYRSKDSERFAEYKWVRILLPTLRFFLGSILAFLLLGPVLMYAGYITQKPIIAVVVDDSKSMIQSGEATEGIAKQVADLQIKLSEKYEVDIISYSNVPQFTTADKLIATGSETNISRALRYTKEQYVNQNLGGVVLLTDGIYNGGSNPSFIAETYQVPIYTIGMGDTTVYADIGINNVSHNSLAYLGNEFPLRIEVKAAKLTGKQANVQVLLNGSTILQKSVFIDKENFFYEADVVAKAQKLGQNKVEVRLTTFDNEKNTANNLYTLYIEVIDGKKKVNIWAEAPHPDLGMLRAALNTNENYETAISLKSYEVSSDIDLVILHNWFATQAQLSLYEKLKSSGIPVLLIVGDDFNSRIFNSGSQDITFSASGRGTNAALPLINGGFEYFELEADLAQNIKKWPPLKAAFGRYKGYQPSDILLYQQIGSVTTQEPLILLNSSNKSRLGIVAGTGLWQWRLIDFEKNETHDGVNSLVTKMVQYLAVKEDKKLLKIYPSAKQYGVGEDVTLLGELYNQSLDPISGQEININLKDADSKVYKHTMTASGSQYRLELQNLEAGAYLYEAKATVGGVSLADKGYFTIVGQQKELVNLTADFNMLRGLSSATGGKFVSLTGADVLGDNLLENESLKSVIAEENKLEDLIKFQWIFWLLVSLLSIEWFVRKWAGGY